MLIVSMACTTGNEFAFELVEEDEDESLILDLALALDSRLKRSSRISSEKDPGLGRTPVGEKSRTEAAGDGALSELDRELDNGVPGVIGL